MKSTNLLTIVAITSMDIPVGTGRPLQELSNFRSAKRSVFDGYIIRGSIFFRPFQGGFRGYANSEVLEFHSKMRSFLLKLGQCKSPLDPLTPGDG